MKKVIQLVLVAAIILLGYLLYESISNPIRFNKEKKKRYDATIERLKDIRTAQLAYKSEHGEFVGEFDKLIDFLKHDSFSVVKAIGFVPDSLTEAQALEKGLVSRDTIKVSVKDSLFSENYNLDEIRNVPYRDTAKIQLGAGVLKTGSGVEVQVFEAKVHNNVLLKGLDKQLIINLNDERETVGKYPGLKVGSLTEATNNAGNWE